MTPDYSLGFSIKFSSLPDPSRNTGEMFLTGNSNVKESDIIGCFKRRDKTLDKLTPLEHVPLLKLTSCKQVSTGNGTRNY